MNRFHHGGRVGDALYALYTVKKLGGGEFYLSLYHTPGWDEGLINSLLPLIEHQRYITKVGQCPPPPRFGDLDITHDLHAAENDFNPEHFPDWQGPTWPGDKVPILKRYAVHFGIEPDFEEIWLAAPKTREADVVFHMPHRRMIRDPDLWVRLLLTLKNHYKLKVVILAGENDKSEWAEFTNQLDVVVPENFLETADWINSCNVFVGAASSCNVIAEGLKKWRMVDIAPGCDDIYACGRTGFTMNTMQPGDIISLIILLQQKKGVWDCGLKKK